LKCIREGLEIGAQKNDELMKDNGFGSTRITDFIVGFGLLVLGMVLLFVYGHFGYLRRFETKLPMTNMRDVERVFGRPVSVFSLSDGTIRWDYSHWWSGTAKVYFKTDGSYYRTFTEF
jgi:hypothetical protein